MAKKDFSLEKIDALAELTRLGVSYTPRGENEVAVCCPVHGDTSPSASLNTKKNLWRCHSSGCEAKGDLISFIAHSLKLDRTAVFVDLAKRYEISIVKCIDPNVVEEYHSKISLAGPLLQALRDRGLTDEEIRYARLGFHDGRITIPIYDDKRRVVNLRKYLPGAPGAEKMKNIHGYGGAHLYQPEDLKYPTIWVMGGEIKALKAKFYLNKFNIGAVAVSAGEGAWKPQFSAMLKDKDVCVCMDVDPGGRAAARKICSQIFSVAKSVRNILLPLDMAKHPKGDINDFAHEGGTADQLLEVATKTPLFVPPVLVDVPEEVIELPLSEAARAEHIGKRIEFEGVIQALDETPFLIPSHIAVTCTKDQPGCTLCPVSSMPQNQQGAVELRIKGASAGVLGIVAAPTSRKAVLEAFKIPPCKVAEIQVLKHVDAFDVRLTPKLTAAGRNADFIVQAAYVIGKGIELNTPYIFRGKVHPHPKNQQAMMVIDEIAQSKDSLSDFQLKPDELAELEMFRSTDISAKLDEIYDDLEANITRIYRRRDLHLLVDLSYHSLNRFYFEGILQRGWMNSLVVGDSSQGKSETTLRLMEHYRVGERIDCKNASVAGLLGGVSPIGNRWMISWGLIPTNDRRLVILEEVKGASTEVLSKLTDMRSSGTAEIGKIEKRRSHARTRLIFVTNPRSDRPVSSYTFGIETFSELMGALEDIRRFDACLLMSSQQISSAEINRLTSDRPKVTHKFSSRLCRNLVLWAWTRSPEQVKLSHEAEVACRQEAIALCDTFTDVMPLIDKGTTHLKIARLAAALAARLFSTEDGETVLVTEEHVKFVVAWIRRVYSDPVFGYLEFTKAQDYMTKLIDPKGVTNEICTTRHPSDLVDSLLNTEDISVDDLKNWCEFDRDEADSMLSLFVRRHALFRVKKWYRKSPGFINLLKELKTKELKSSRRSEL